ncbi:MAG: hypothetical protein P1P81_11680 [Desulfobulbales bacterium]|nr:hypothetical protein [Desulfobulbales bacterium]
MFAHTLGKRMNTVVFDPVIDVVVPTGVSLASRRGEKILKTDSMLSKNSMGQPLQKGLSRGPWSTLSLS